MSDKFFADDDDNDEVENQNPLDDLSSSDDIDMGGFEPPPGSKRMSDKKPSFHVDEEERENSNNDDDDLPDDDDLNTDLDEELVDISPNSSKQSKKSKPTKSGASKKAKKMPSIITKMWPLFILLCCIIFGLLTGLTLANKQVPTSSGNFYTLFTPSSDSQALRTFIDMVKSSETQIVVIAKHINGLPMLDMLIEQQQLDKQVLIVLDREANSKAKSPYTYLLSKGFNKDNLFIASVPVENQTIIIDQKHVLTGSLLFNNSGQQSASDFIYIEDQPELATTYLTFAKKLAQSSLQQ